jgi:hypothetical protein
MTALRHRIDASRRLLGSAREIATTFARDVGQGMLEVSHNMLALVGLLVVAGMVFVVGRPDLRAAVEAQAHGWLQSRLEARADPADVLAARLAEPDAIERATAADPQALDRQQQAVAQWIARRYRVAPEPISRLVQEAWVVGRKAGIEPTLILAIMAVESSFNPFAQSSMGAQGLMQVMTRVHDDKYEPFGGTHAAFDPVTNLRVGVQVLKECIRRAGSVEGGLRHYVGAANLPDDGGYAGRVMAEQGFLKQVAQGKSVPTTATAPIAPQPVAQGDVPGAAPRPMGRTGNADGAAGDDTPLLPPSFSSDPQALPAPVVS